MIVNGVRMDHIRKCRCGRRPEVITEYEGMEPGFGPFIIKCYCGRDPEGVDENGRQNLPSFARSWSKTRAVKIWRRMNQPQTV